jgi:hypothetical protein
LCISRSTSFDADGEYLRFVAMIFLPTNPSNAPRLREFRQSTVRSHGIQCDPLYFECAAPDIGSSTIADGRSDWRCFAVAASCYASLSICSMELTFRLRIDREVGTAQERNMGRGALLWLIGIPIPIILLVWLLGGLH